MKYLECVLFEAHNFFWLELVVSYLESVEVFFEVCDSTLIIMSALCVIYSHGGVRQCLCGAWFLTGPFFIPWVINEQIWNIGGMLIDRGRHKCSEKNMSQCYFVHKKFHVDYPETEPSLQMRSHWVSAWAMAWSLCVMNMYVHQVHWTEILVICTLRYFKISKLFMCMIKIYQVQQLQCKKAMVFLFVVAKCDQKHLIETVNKMEYFNYTTVLNQVWD